MDANSFEIISFPDEDTWQECLTTIRIFCKNDPLFENYANLDPKAYLHFNAVVYQKKIISFGAIEYSPQKWGGEIARVLTRFWIHPDFRSKNLTKWERDKIRFSPLILEKQMEFLEKQEKIKVAMITREGSYKKSFREIIRLAKTVKKDFEIFPGIFNVCEKMNSIPHSCQQMIALAGVGSRDKRAVFQNSQNQGFFKKISDE